ncbi:MAG TPA: zf-TFIIB domain-containing protein [Deltaproteobacteria bacterium]|mgnify:FL=1|jgi:hypothetical protein|nr:zf-TFIIB domain-containing protein [Deltaproteobacteria bacterium]HQJ07483.1 zf-TFIIB domain-containing protein [Deltaproteobacteria bacterium]
MIVMKCPKCGRKVVWDDFQPMDIKCPGCRADLNVRTSLRESIERRRLQSGEKIHYCPRCKGIVPRRWFTRCPKCRYWLFGPVTFHGNWPFVIGISVIYLIFALYYAMFVR